jgi:hypothetical protein
MEAIKLIRIEKVCLNYAVDVSFIKSLNELGHIKLIVENDIHYIPEIQLKSLESFMYFHTELNINLEGIDAIAHLLVKNEFLQNELILLQNKLSFYDQNVDV